MISDFAVSIEAAIAAGYIEVADSARVSRDVRVIHEEDDGSTRGKSSVGASAIVRSGVVICSGVAIGENCVVGLNAILRAGVSIGANCVVSHGVCIERDTRIGVGCRISALSHLTGGCLIEDFVQVGARVVTINDKEMRWRGGANLRAPIIRAHARIGSGASLLAGIEIGEWAVIGAGAVVTRDIPARTVAWGVPAYVQREGTDSH